MTEIEELDWDGDIEAWHEDGWKAEHPNLLAFVTVEQWVASDADVRRAIDKLHRVLDARGVAR